MDEHRYAYMYRDDDPFVFIRNAIQYDYQTF